MAAPVYRPSGVLAGTFGVGILTFLLLPSEVGYQDLAALIARDAATVERPQKHGRVSALGTMHVSNLNLPQPVGSGIQPSSLGYTLAGLDPNNAEITGSIRDRILRESGVLLAPAGTNPWVDRTHKGDQLTSAARQRENIALKGDRLDAGAVLQAEVKPGESAPVPQVPAPQVAEAPATPSVEPPQVAVQAQPQPDAAQQTESQPAQPQLAEQSEREPSAQQQVAEQAEPAPQLTPKPVELTEQSQPVDPAEGTQPSQALNSPAQIAEAELAPPEAAEPSEQTAPTRQAKVESKSAERDADARPSKSRRAEKPSRSRRAQSRRAERLARLQQQKQQRAEKAARIQEARLKAAEETGQKTAEKTARAEAARKAAAAQKLAQSEAARSQQTAKLEQPAVAPQQTEPAAEQAEGATQAAPLPVEAAAATAATQPPAEEQQPARFTVASAGDYRIGLNPKQFERATAPTDAAQPSKREGNAEAEGATGKTDALKPAIAYVEGGPTKRTERVFFSVDPMGKKIGAIEPWAPGAEPRLADGSVGDTAGKDAEVKLAALPSADSVLGVPSLVPDVATAAPNQSVNKDPSGNGGQSIAPKGQVTGADQRPKTPAERLGLNDEKSRAKSVKCLTEVIYFESRGEQVRGQMAVAQVVLNRAFSGKYPATVCGVVYQNAHRHLACQFTFACDGIPDRVKEPDMWERATVIANEMLDGKIWLPEVGKATHYHAHWVHPGWVREMTKLYRVGVHTFYRPRAWGDGGDAPQWGDVSETQEVTKKLVEVANKP